MPLPDPPASRSPVASNPPVSSRSILPPLQTFLETPLENLLHLDQVDQAAAAAVQLFQTVAQTVPAYQSFLERHGIEAASIATFADFQRLPLTTKANYLQQSALPQLCRGGQLEQCDMIAVSSGSTGQPSFWLRSVADELAIATRFEQIFRDSFAADRRRTLAIVCFALGTWVGGMYTANCCRHLASKGYPLNVITPGNNKTEILRIVPLLAPLYDQVVLLGYPPFLKDVIDTGLAAGVPWQTYRVKWVMAGEVFSEEWRSLVGERLGSTNFYFDSASLYGTADAGVLGNETPLSICIRRWLAQQPEVARSLFGESRLPTLVQYDPLSRFFEVQQGTLLFSGNNGIPLVRYHIADQGGIISYGQMLEFLAAHHFDPIAELTASSAAHLEARGISTLAIPTLPFVYVFGRSHFIVSYFGANIYPENVTVGLEQSPVCDWVTGKFVMQVLEDADRNEFLSIVVELAPEIEASAEKAQAIATAIVYHLCRLNSEFANYVPQSYQIPRILLKPSGDPDYFPLGVKHRYTRR